MYGIATERLHRTLSFEFPQMTSFKKQISWIETQNENNKELAAQIVIWQFLNKTIKHLIEKYNEVLDCEDSTTKDTSEGIHLKKLIIGMLYETNEVIDVWNDLLRKQDTDLEDADTFKAERDKKIRIISKNDLRNIRNDIAFHSKKILSDPDKLLQRYKALDDLEIDSLNNLHKAITKYGYKLRDKAVELLD